MHVHFEQNTCTRTDSAFLSLSWMGKVPEDLPEEGGGWKLNRAQYYVEGWLASGNARGVVGVTFSTSHCHSYDAPPRSNFNLRGHRSEVVLVRWNEPYQKLATCDSRGVIFVWIKHEGRWSIELINDRNSQVTDFAWSHDGRMALICYHDGFILVGSVAGQRYWSSMLNLENTSITCGVWSPDDQQVMFGTLDGQIIVMSSTGLVVTQVAVHEGFEITSMAWSCERFNMEEAENGRDGAEHVNKDATPKSHVLAVCFKYGDIFLMSGYDDVCPVMVYTTLTGVKIDWSNCGEYLAVGGFVRLPNLQCRNEVHFYSKNGSLIHWVNLPSQGKPLTALTWGHNDKRLFIAAGCHMYVAWVSKQVAPLQFLCQRVAHQSLRSEKAVDKLPLPQRLRCGVKALFSPTIKSYIPDPLRLREFVCSPPPGGERLFCTMIHHGEETSGGHYTLYLEYLGGLVPLLKGKRASKLRPDFIIYDPKIKSSGKAESKQTGGTIESDTSSESDVDVYTDGCGSPRMQRRRRPKVFRAEKVNRSITFRTLDDLMYDDNLPETSRLVEVTSNIWGTKFQITGVASSLPACLGQVVYKTSLLHLQPRQMTITITEITPSRPVLSRDPNFTPAPFNTDDEDDFCSSKGDLTGEKKTVEVTVHDAPFHPGDVPSSKQDGGSMTDGGHRQESASVESSNVESNVPPNEDMCSLARKLSSSGTMHSRSLPQNQNSLIQTVPNFKQEKVCSDTWQDMNSISGWQGARPKADLNKHYPNSAGSNVTTRSNIPNGSPKLSGVSSNKCAALSSNNHSSAHPNSHYANGNCVMTHLTQTCTNRVESFPSSTPVAVGSKKMDNISGFKRVDVGNYIEKGRGGGVNVEGVWRSEEQVSLALLKDQSALSQRDTGSSCTSAEDVVIPLADLDIGPRWADPAAQAVKLHEEGMTEATDTSFENNLIADCSPTAPNCQDLHRRLYLAQQNIVDTGAPISPSSCPACQPVHYAASTDQCSTTPGISLSHSDLTAQNNMKNYSPGSIQIREGLVSGFRASEDRQTCPFHGSSVPTASLMKIFEIVGTDTQQTEQRELTKRNVLPFHRDPPDNHAKVYKSCSPQDASLTLDSAMAQHFLPYLVGDSNKSHQSLLMSNVGLNSSVRSTSLSQKRVLQDQNKQIQDSSKDGGMSFLQIKQGQDYRNISPSKHCHEPNEINPVYLRQNSVPHTPTSHSHSRLPKDLSSFEKLNLILSEDQSTQTSVHNFRSMPGFVMKNPDLKDEDENASSPDRDIYENSLTFPCNEDLTSNNIHDNEIHLTSASLPSSPIRFGAKQNFIAKNLHEEILKGRCRHLSPLLGRKGRDIPLPVKDFFDLDDPRINNYESLEAFQKAQLRQKVRRRLNEASARLEPTRTFTMHNKAPLWNETSQVYQLDFGGRVTQESAKNFQIELRGKQVMQFGRIDNSAYTLDFQHPFTAVQAFAVALANVTQRLK